MAASIERDGLCEAGLNCCNLILGNIAHIGTLPIYEGIK